MDESPLPVGRKSFFKLWLAVTPKIMMVLHSTAAGIQAG
jgi:hypothetical protein